MSDESLAPDPLRAPIWRSAAFVTPLAFLCGIGAAAGAMALAGGLAPHPAPPPPVVQVKPQPQPSAPALPPASDVATLDAREAALAGRLDQIERRIRDADTSARGAAGYATRAENLMVAFVVRRAIERGLPLGALDAQLRARFAEGHGEAVAAIEAAAAQPVTLDDLRLALDGIAPRLGTAPNEGLWAQMRRMLTDLVVLRRADAPSPRASDRLRRARQDLTGGDVDAALGEVARMPGAATAEAESWIGAARRYLAARNGLNEIESAAADLPAPAPQAAR